MKLDQFLFAKDAKNIANNHVPEETKQVLEQIGDEIVKIAKKGECTLIISEMADAWYPYFNKYAVQFLEKCGYKVTYDYGGVDGNSWFISW